MRLTRRQRRDLAALERQLAAESPELAVELSAPAGRARPGWGPRTSWALAWSALVLFLVGVLLSTSTLIGVAVTILMTCWLPAHLAPGDPTGRA